MYSSNIWAYQSVAQKKTLTVTSSNDPIWNYEHSNRFLFLYDIQFINNELFDYKGTIFDRLNLS